MKRIIMLTFGVLAGIAFASFAQYFPTGPNSFTGYLTNESALAFNRNYSIDLSTYSASRVAAQVFYSSASPANVTFLDGATSSGTFTVSDYTKLSSATATGRATVVSTSNLGGAVIQLGGYSKTNGTDWFTGATKQLTAVSLASAIATIPNISANAAGGIVYTTAAVGAYANQFTYTSNNTSVTINSGHLSGGQDAAYVTIGTQTLTSGRQWYASVSSDTTGTSLAAAINTAFPTTLVAAEGTGANKGIVSVTAKLDGPVFNYAIASSTPTALLASASSLVNGVNSGFQIGSQIFVSTTAIGLTRGLAYLYAIGSNPAIGGLTTGTTYYGVPVTSSQFSLAKYSTSAVVNLAADFVTVTSSASNVFSSEHTYTLTPLAIGGTASFAWQSSNDNVNWSNVLSVSTNTVSSYTNPPTNAIYDFGPYNFRYIRLNVVAPTTGGLFIQSNVNIKQDGIGRF